MNRQLMTVNRNNNFSGIAVVGLSGRFPGAKDVDEFWHNLRNGIESITEYTDIELKAAGVPSDIINDPNYVKKEFFLEDVDMFDADFFGFSPVEASAIDPQQRLFLESSWNALENAGYNPETYDGLIGVYAGTAMNNYIFNIHTTTCKSDKYYDAVSVFQRIVGIEKDYLSTRVSYKLNLKGPSLTVQTACSTSLLAIHLACQSLLNYECDMALAGGVNIKLPQRRGYIYVDGMLLSPDGHCRAFDNGSKGTVMGDGLGIVVLKRLEEALQDGDTIHAVIKGSAINNDGAEKVGYTAPSINGQADVIETAQALAQINPETITYHETHGTGTILGDPIEIAALTQAFRASTQKKGFCAIGSVKTNIGHLEVAAGVASLIKTVLAIEHKEIPPSLNFEKPNTRIDFKNSPFYVNSSLKKWKKNGTPRRASVSSFGIGGTNAHVILEEAPKVQTSGKSRTHQLLLLSARTGNALDAATKHLVKHLKQYPQNIADVAYTLKVGRKAFGHRRMAVCRNNNDAITHLELFLSPNADITSFHEPINRNVVFMFSGQGSQYVNMGVGLYKTESTFKEDIDKCSAILRSHLSFDLQDVLYPEKENIEEAADKLRQTYITQPALFTIEYSLARLWMRWGVCPTALVGHSIGEYVAACLAGVFSLEEALALVASRGRLIQKLPGGSMLAVSLSEEAIQPFLGDKLSLAVINTPSMCVISGEKEAISALEKRLADQKINSRNLITSHAFHSRMIEPILDKFLKQLEGFKFNLPQIPFVSNVSGTWIEPEEATNPEYWVKHLRQTVRFSDCLKTLLSETNRVLIEVGPGNTLSTFARQRLNKANGEHVVVPSTRHPYDDKSDVEVILNAIGQLWLAGIDINWSDFYSDEMRHRISLPTYPFERKHYWIESGKQAIKADPELPASQEQYNKTTTIDQWQPEEHRKKILSDGTQNDVEKVISNIWQELLGVEHVEKQDNFFDLGGSSLIAVSLFAKMEKLLGKRLPLATLFEAPTVEKLSNIIHRETGHKPWSSLVEIRSHGSKPPLFLIHAAGGNVLNYRTLVSHLSKDQPVYGLQSQGLDGKQPFLAQVEDMAAKYIEEIQNVQPEGSYFLGGYCLGGTIAIEMAQQLRAQGHHVALVALLETYNWAKVHPISLSDNVYYFMQKIEFHRRNLLLLNSSEKVTFFKEKGFELKRRSKLWYETIASKISRNKILINEHNLLLARLWAHNDRVAIDYLPKYYLGNLTLFLPAKQYARFDTPECLWYKQAEDVEIYELPLYPAGMLLEPFVRLLAKKLDYCINNTL